MMMKLDPVAAAIIIVAAATVLSCSSATQGTTSDRCQIAPADSALLKAGPLYTECSVDQRAIAIQRRVDQPSSIPPVMPRGTACMRAEVQFVVGMDGRPEPGTARLISGNSPEFSNLVMTSVVSWSYRPATLKGQPVRQLVREKMAVALMVVRVIYGEAATRPPRPSNCP